MFWGTGDAFRCQYTADVFAAKTSRADLLGSLGAAPNLHDAACTGTSSLPFGGVVQCGEKAGDAGARGAVFLGMEGVGAVAAAFVSLLLR
jgi:hypothetical protein